MAVGTFFNSAGASYVDSRFGITDLPDGTTPAGDGGGALRHAVGMIETARQHGADVAKRVGEAHERGPVGVSGIFTGDRSNTRTPSQVDVQDLYNNKVAIDAASDPRFVDMPAEELAAHLLMSGRLRTTAVKFPP